jgi:uncharacterized protein YpmB
MAKKEMKNIRPDEKHKVWKITAIIFIILFIVIIVSALVRLSRSRPPLIEPTDAQVSIVKGIALTDLSNRGEQIQNFSVSTSPDIRPVSVGQATKKVLEVSVYNDSIRHLYIIDVDSGNVLLYSKTESFGFINYSNDRPVPPGNMELGFGRRGP